MYPLIFILLFAMTSAQNAAVETESPLPKYPDTYGKYFLPDQSGYSREWAQGYEPFPPYRIKSRWHRWYLDKHQAQQIVNMTAEIVKDCHMKLRHLNVIQKEYQQDPNYELGVIAATVMEKFGHMVKIYKYYGVKEAWDVEYYQTTSDIIMAYQAMLSDYNEIRIEKNLFYDVLKATALKAAEEKKTNAEDKMMYDLYGKYQSGTIGYGDLNKLNQDELRELKKARDEEILKAKGRYARRRGKTARVLPQSKLELAHEEYKRSLRQHKWMQKWRGFNPDVEGISVTRPLAKAGLENASDFLGLNAF